MLSNNVLMTSNVYPNLLETHETNWIFANAEKLIIEPGLHQ